MIGVEDNCFDAQRCGNIHALVDAKVRCLVDTRIGGMDAHVKKDPVESVFAAITIQSLVGVDQILNQLGLIQNSRNKKVIVFETGVILFGKVFKFIKLLKLWNAIYLFHLSDPPCFAFDL